MNRDSRGPKAVAVPSRPCLPSITWPAAAGARNAGHHKVSTIALGETSPASLDGISAVLLCSVASVRGTEGVEMRDTTQDV